MITGCSCWNVRIYAYTPGCAETLVQLNSEWNTGVSGEKLGPVFDTRTFYTDINDNRTQDPLLRPNGRKCVQFISRTLPSNVKS